MDIVKLISKELKINENQVQSAVRLLDEGNTVPFIARYRKEVTGSLDDNQLRELSSRLEYLRNLDKRRGEILSSIEEQGALTEELNLAIEQAETLSVLEDLYLPFKKKRKTRASIAKEKGLLPLAEKIFLQTGSLTAEKLAEEFIDPTKDVNSAQEAVLGAKDIIAENISDNAAVRSAVRDYLWQFATIEASKAKDAEDEKGVYATYYEFSESLKKIQGYRVLALDRGENEKILKVSVGFDKEEIFSIASSLVVKKGFSPTTDTVREALEDSLSRLIMPSMEREVRSSLTEAACSGAIKVFGLNLKPLLMQPPCKGKTALGFDPGYRTGCKVAVVDETGKVLDTSVVYPTLPKKDIEGSKKILKALITRYNVEIIAIGNGTASKESEIFIAELIKEIDFPVSYMVVSEAGASVYSASKLAAEEFPEYDVSLRSAVSIARRLQDPLAELVKIDPKAIGVGQYQHDMPKKELDETLKGVVEDCVNSVGVDANTASFSLLSYVAGIGPSLAKSIVSYREENGKFNERKELLKVPKLGKRAFTQCAGFLRIIGGENPLDSTSVHPESYKAARELMKLCKISYEDLGRISQDDLKNRIKLLGEQMVLEKLQIGSPTLNDIISELSKPGRDIRDELPPPLLRSDLLSLSDLKSGMELTGTVRNVVDFGAFVDIGVHEDGLVHISHLCDRFIKHPSQVVKVGDIVKVKVLEIDEKRHRIALTMKGF